jgi:beta-lactam-binding protein with PASTA domain
MGVIAVVAALLALLAWFFWPSADTRTPATRADVDSRELEEAEREVQEAPDEHSVRDWGPGVSKPPI